MAADAYEVLISLMGVKTEAVNGFFSTEQCSVCFQMNATSNNRKLKVKVKDTHLLWRPEYVSIRSYVSQDCFPIKELR